MGSRDHSIECETCGYDRGGLNDLKCECDDPHAMHLLAIMSFEAECRERLDTLAANLAIACMLDRAWSLGYAAAGDAYGITDGSEWHPGTGKAAPCPAR